MEPCWNLEPKDRPSFSNLAREIEEFVYKEDLDQYNHLNDLFNKENLTRLTSNDFPDILEREWVSFPFHSFLNHSNSN